MGDLIDKSGRPRDKLNIIAIKDKLILHFFWSNNSHSIQHIHLSHLHCFIFKKNNTDISSEIYLRLATYWKERNKEIQVFPKFQVSAQGEFTCRLNNCLDDFYIGWPYW